MQNYQVYTRRDSYLHSLERPVAVCHETQKRMVFKYKRQDKSFWDSLGPTVKNLGWILLAMKPNFLM